MEKTLKIEREKRGGGMVVIKMYIRVGLNMHTLLPNYKALKETEKNTLLLYFFGE